ncbi:uncharacterized protein BX664DRAFT_335429 [Halteromyces radiatus]|uniref:uncharacterized protein n=1 Tax=Halteromyces radiatus TaxID=101107 RepID=UPI00222059D8|nr:uncharacterized protein BX664DRAFT_335429 [Halteromyces radiatus]KAI8086288.1 hypothetical protein BX664DRAFT_335429 [Halteromyces radiatus]
MDIKSYDNERTSNDSYTRKKGGLSLSMTPTQQDIDIVRYSWERVIDLQHDQDNTSTVSPAQAFGLAFYDALFELDPETRSLFGSNVLIQAKMLTGVIGYITRAPMITAIDSQSPTSPRVKMNTIREINARKREQEQQRKTTTTTTKEEEVVVEEDIDPEWLAIQLQELGARHHFYNVKPEQFQLIGPAIDIALRKRLRNEYTKDIGKAWIKTHAYVAHHMTQGILSEQQRQQQLLDRKKSTSSTISSSLLQRSSSTSSSSSSSNCCIQ